MERNEADWQKLVKGLAAGDEQACTDFWQEYGNRLEKVAGHRLPGGLKRRMGPEDVVQSACRTFFRRASTGQLELGDSASLWRLVCAITLNKMRMHVRFHMRERRAADCEEDLGSNASGTHVSLDPAAWGGLPDESVIFAEQLQRVMDQLDSEECQWIELKLQDYSQVEIAERLGRSERTIRRIERRVRKRLERSLEDGI